MDRSWIPTTAGVLDLLAGTLALIGFAALVFIGFILRTAPDVDQDEFGIALAQALFAALAMGALLLALLALFGGVCALQRRRFGWALAGAIAAAVLCAPLGVPSLILTVVAEQDMRKALAPTGSDG